MHRARLSVIEPLELVAVKRYGARLHLAVRDRKRTRHVISFRFERPADAREHERRTRRWKSQRTPLAYIRGQDESALVDMDALLARAAG